MAMVALRPAVRLPTLLAAAALSSARALSMPSSRIVDSHLHVWATAAEAASSYPYAGPEQVPPAALRDVASPAELLKRMDAAGVDGALVVQPINHKFDHSYVTNAIREHPTRLKGMMLHDPALPPEAAVERLEELVLAGYVGVRFNPYLWPDGEEMSAEGGCGRAVYRRCGELKVPVGVMCFKGLGRHYDDILHLVAYSPDTPLILDHLGFCALNDAGDVAFEQLLSLAKYPSVHVKVSALFRNTGDDDAFPYDGVKARRFDPLMEAYGSERLMMGSDFPFVLETEGSYEGAVETVKSWVLEESDRDGVLGGTAERLFGNWGDGSDEL